MAHFANFVKRRCYRVVATFIIKFILFSELIIDDRCINTKKWIKFAKDTGDLST